MPLVLDHVLIAVHALPAAVDNFAALGFRVRRGPTDSATERASIAFADGARLELLAWSAPAPQDARWRRLQQHGEGIVDYALTTQQAAVAAADVHGNGALGVESLAIAVHDVDAERARLRTLAGAGDPGMHLGAALALPVVGTRLATVQLAGSALLLMAPRTGSLPIPEEHPLALRLAACGEGPYAVVLRTHGGPAWTADLRLAHGAALEFAPVASQPAPIAPPSTAMVGG